MEKDQQYDQNLDQEQTGSDTILFQPPGEEDFPNGEEENISIEDLLNRYLEEPSEPVAQEENTEGAPETDAQRDTSAEPKGEEEPTIVKAPKRKGTTPWSVTWKITKYVWRIALGVVLAIGILIMGLVGYLTVTEYNPAYAETADRGSVNRSETITSDSFSILTFNTGYAALGADADFFMDGGKGVLPEDQEWVEKNMEGIEGILSLADADFIFLQEVDVGSQRSFHTNQWLKYEYGLREYESRFALNYSCEYVPYPFTSPLGEVQSGLVTYSKYDIVSSTRYSQPNGQAWPNRVANLKRCLLVSRIPIEDSEQQLVLINVHMEDYDDAQLRKEQVQQLLELMKEEYAKGNFVIAGGDFNQIFPNSYAYKNPDDELWSPQRLGPASGGFRYIYDEENPTCRLLNQPYDPDSEDTRYYVIDGFLVSPNVSVSHIETLDYEFIYSDHNPVLLNFALNFDE